MTEIKDPFAETDTFRAISLSQARVSRVYHRTCRGCGHKLHAADACGTSPTLSAPGTRCICPVDREAIAERHVIGVMGR